MLIGATALALIWANSPLAASYEWLQNVHIGPEAIGLNLSLQHWAADAVLVVFFFVVGLELKRELTIGSLSTRASAITPVVAAVGGMAVPALIYLLINLNMPGGQPGGWAIPTATDIAFALTILMVFGKGIPPAARAFLLALAVADDLMGITIIALFYSDGIQLLWLLGSFAAIVLFALLLRSGVTAWWIILPLGVLVWLCMFYSGVHPTVAGLLLGLCVPASRNVDDGPDLVARYEKRWSPLAIGLAIPFFAFMSTGLSLSLPALQDALTDPVGLGIILGLVIGKPIGIVTATVIAQLATRGHLSNRLRVADVLAVSFFAGIGLTVSLLISDLAFRSAPELRDEAVLSILLASLLATVLGALMAWFTRIRRRRDTKTAEFSWVNTEAITIERQQQKRRRSRRPITR